MGMGKGVRVLIPINYEPLKTANGEAPAVRSDPGSVILRAEYTFSILNLVKRL